MVKLRNEEDEFSERNPHGAGLYTLWVFVPLGSLLLVAHVERPHHAPRASPETHKDTATDKIY